MLAALKGFQNGSIVVLRGGSKVDRIQSEGEGQAFLNAILAICDAVEAASRTLKKPDHASIDNLVQRIVYGKMHLGQLDESGLFDVTLNSTEWVTYKTEYSADGYPIFQLGWFPVQGWSDSTWTNLVQYVPLPLLLVVAVWWLLQRTTLGLRWRAVGENPQMVDAAGVSVLGLRYGALVLNGVLCGLAGAYLVMAQNASFSPNMTAGRGYMALAAMIFGKWRPLPAFAACLLFGFLDALAIRLQGAVWPVIGEVPVQLIQALPYLLTVILLAGFIGRTVAPKALGQPYVKER